MLRQLEQIHGVEIESPALDSDEAIPFEVRDVSLDTAIKVLLGPWKTTASVDGKTIQTSSAGALRDDSSIAILSDIQGNLEALDAVLTDARKEGVANFCSLGNVAGLGPNPVECVNVAMTFEVCILGVCDQAVMFDPDDFNPVALRAVHWSRDVLEGHPKHQSEAAVNSRWDFLAAMPRTYEMGKRLFVHGSPREPTTEYVYPEDVYDTRKMQEIFRRFDHHCFAGLTGIPGVFTEAGDFMSPQEIDGEYHLDNERCLVNVGSVGNPRNCDPRACYVILDGATVRFRRVDYDLERTIAKIYSIPDVDNIIGDGLRYGRGVELEDDPTDEWKLEDYDR